VGSRLPHFEVEGGGGSLDAVVGSAGRPPQLTLFLPADDGSTGSPSVRPACWAGYGCG
jgi:hypothetical protein